MSPFVLQAALVALASLALGAVVARLTRLRAISFRFTLAWSLIAALGLLAAPLIPLVEPVASLLELSPAALLTVAVTLVLVTIALQLSVSVSQLIDQVGDLAEAQALSAHDRAGAAHGTERREPALVVVPAWNERATVGHVVRAVAAQGFDVVVVDDGSTDDTAQVARAAGAVVLRLPTNLGVGGALRTAFRYALASGYERIVQCDADGQHPTTEIDRLLREQLSEDADMLIGSRFVVESATGLRLSRGRLMAMSVLARSASKAAGTRLTDATSGFRVIRRPLLDELAQELPNHYLGDTYEAVIAAARSGYRIAEVPVTMRDRRHGVSSASTAAAVQFTVRVFAVVALRAHISLRPRTDYERQLA